MSREDSETESVLAGGARPGAQARSVLILSVDTELDHLGNLQDLLDVVPDVSDSLRVPGVLLRIIKKLQAAAVQTKSTFNQMASLNLPLLL